MDSKLNRFRKFAFIGLLLSLSAFGETIGPASGTFRRTFPASHPIPIHKGAQVRVVDLRFQKGQAPQFLAADMTLQGLINRRMIGPSVFVLTDSCFSTFNLEVPSCPREKLEGQNDKLGGHDLFWLNRTKEIYGIGVSAVINESTFLWNNIKHVLDNSGKVKIIIYDPKLGPPQMNMAVTLAGVYKALPIESTKVDSFLSVLNEGRKKKLELTTQFLSGHDFNLTKKPSPWVLSGHLDRPLGMYRWLWSLTKELVTKEFFALENGYWMASKEAGQAPAFVPNNYHESIDYFVQHRAFVFEFSQCNPERTQCDWDPLAESGIGKLEKDWVINEFLPSYDEPGFRSWKPVMGNFGLGSGENQTVEFLSRHRKFIQIGTLANLSVYTGLPVAGPLKQKPSNRLTARQLKYDANKTYVLWTFTQGDALDFVYERNLDYWLERDPVSGKLYRNEVPSAFMGDLFGAELFPTATKYFYSKQNSKLSKASFVTGPGYMKFSVNERDADRFPSAMDTQNWLEIKLKPSIQNLDLHTVWFQNNFGTTAKFSCETAWPVAAMTQWLQVFGDSISNFLMYSPYGNAPCDPKVVPGYNVSVSSIGFTLSSVDKKDNFPYTVPAIGYLDSDVDKVVSDLRARGRTGAGNKQFLLAFLNTLNPGLGFIAKVRDRVGPDIIFVTADEFAFLQNQAPKQ